MANPILNENFGTSNQSVTLAAEPMTISGTISKILILFAFLLIGALCNWHFFATGMLDKVNMFTMVGGIVGFILAMIITFNVNLAKVLSPVYALCEGIVLGGISAIFEKIYPGIVVNATIGTFATFGTMLFLYKIRAIRYTEKFATVLFTAICSIAIIYLIDIVASFWGRGIPMINTATPVGIGFSIVVILFAALSFIQDFYIIEEGAQNMYSKDYEWYGAFGIMITFVWLYLEMLKLFAKLNQRN